MIQILYVLIQKAVFSSWLSVIRCSGFRSFKRRKIGSISPRFLRRSAYLTRPCSVTYVEKIRSQASKNSGMRDLTSSSSSSMGLVSSSFSSDTSSGGMLGSGDCSGIFFSVGPGLLGSAAADTSGVAVVVLMRTTPTNCNMMAARIM